ncbi:NAD(P)-dependent oxidoreductase [Rubritalea marina]|uniref:NAD(P)-dependent oxidoreductase n=1 Tax=Rubritalea marina TaxID=361055 RepID=UPI00037E6736|nr:NAD(P)-dependent oxidoreductase [Rubritalea marina]
MSTIYVSSISYHKAQSTFEQLNAETEYTFEPVNEQEAPLAKQIQENDVKAFIADIYPYTGALYSALPRGGIIARYGVGHDSIDKNLATQHGLYVANTPGVLDNAVAEHACWMMGAISRHLHTSHRTTIANQWLPQAGVELRGRKVAILGFGRIGQNLCQKLSFGFGMDIIGVDIQPEENFTDLKESVGFSRYTTDRDAALADADYVVLLMAVVPATKHIANAEMFAKMKDSAILINSARGALVDENALYDALSNGDIAGACLDVFEVEPYQPQAAAKDLRVLHNVLLTPHVGSNTAESNAAMASTAAQNIITILEQGPAACPNLVNQ